MSSFLRRVGEFGCVRNQLFFIFFDFAISATWPRLGHTKRKFDKNETYECSLERFTPLKMFQVIEPIIESQEECERLRFECTVGYANARKISCV